MKHILVFLLPMLASGCLCVSVTYNSEKSHHKKCNSSNVKDKVETESASTDRLQFIKHEVINGDTLNIISELYDVTPAKLKKYNPGINHDSDLVVGKTINIPFNQ